MEPALAKNIFRVQMEGKQMNNISLLDYFAGCALSGICSNENLGGMEHKYKASFAYSIALEMIKTKKSLSDSGEDIDQNVD